MKAALLKSPGVMELEDVPTPECPPGGALLKMVACAVCGTDVKMLQQSHRDLAYPRILGHEIVGRIAEIDKACGLKEGDLCQVWPGIACGSCRPCLQGADNRCRNMLIMGFNFDGGFAEYMALPEQSLSRGVNPLPQSFDPAVAALAEPLACCINGQELTRVSEGDVVLIHGAGPIGALHALLAELKGAGKVIVAEKLTERIREIEKHTCARAVDLSNELSNELPNDQSTGQSIGRTMNRSIKSPGHERENQQDDLESIIQSETGGAGVDVILTATPEVRVNSSQLHLLAPGGRICIFSGPRPGNYEEQIDLRSMHYHESLIVGAYGCSSRQNRLAVELLTAGKIEADWIVTKRTTLSSIEEAFSHSSQRTGLKSVVCGV
jgi:L-iditol 2-dehydrogenase